MLFPTAKSGFFFKTEWILNVNSGNVVPKEMNNNPTNIAGKPIPFAISDPNLTTNF